MRWGNVHLKRFLENKIGTKSRDENVWADLVTFSEKADVFSAIYANIYALSLWIKCSAVKLKPHRNRSFGTSALYQKIKKERKGGREREREKERERKVKGEARVSASNTWVELNLRRRPHPRAV